MLLTFSFANAQSKIYSANSYGSKDRVVGIIENGKIYSANSYGSKDRVVGVFEGGYATGAAGAFLLLL